MREPDRKRIRRAIDHVEAAMTNIDSIKWENRTQPEEWTLNGICDVLQEQKSILESLIINNQ